MLMVLRGSFTDTGASLLPLQPMERQAEDTLQDSGKDHRLEISKMPTCGDR